MSAPMPPRPVLLVGYDNAQILDVACPSGALEMANWLGATPPYGIELATLDGGAVHTSSGIPLGAARGLASVTYRLDTLIVVGGAGHEAAAARPQLVDQIRRLAAISRRVASVCTGATLLAAAGLLDHRRATTHWGYSDRLAAGYPAVAVDPAPLYIRDGHVYTSAGVTSALDLTLALIEDDHGPTLARAVARGLVTYLHRPADQAQISTFLSAPPAEDHLVRDLLGHITAHLEGDLSTAALAVRAGVSPRHLTRLFARHLGIAPTAAVRAARTEAAAHLVTTSELPLAAVAKRCGLGSTETLRQAFLRRYGITPSQMRRRKEADGRRLRGEADGRRRRKEPDRRRKVPDIA